MLCYNIMVTHWGDGYSPARSHGAPVRPCDCAPCREPRYAEMRRNARRQIHGEASSPLHNASLLLLTDGAVWCFLRILERFRDTNQWTHKPPSYHLMAEVRAMVSRYTRQCVRKFVSPRPPSTHGRCTGINFIESLPGTLAMAS